MAKAKVVMNCDKLVASAGVVTANSGTAGKMNAVSLAGAAKDAPPEFSQHCKVFDHHMKVFFF